ncbi:MAG: DUF134 domain-containing protein [Firmicutes bacterium]|nr:DUF134 domain-containing protein [Bacillota bacterium]
MARPPKWRWVEFIPKITHFKPAGLPMRDLDEIVLTHEELEAIRLSDKEMLEQETCAQRMGISRPTFHRIIKGARGKVAEALVGGKAIRIAGGRYRVVKRYYHCHSCNHSWDGPLVTCPPEETHCPQCESGDVDGKNESDGRGGRHRRRRGRGEE